MNFPRKSGVLLHPTSLPGPYGMGEIGPQARAWARALKEMNQSLWQILPHGVTGYGDSPYQCFSTFAGNPLWISFDLLVEDGLLDPSHLRPLPDFPADRVDFARVIPFRNTVLQSVCRTFARRASKKQKEDCEKFCEENAGWLEDFALFMALKQVHELRPWHTWELELVRREPAAMREARRRFKTAVRYAEILQYLFDDQWRRLRRFCRQRGIQFIGDIPIFVAHDSADAWAHPDLFYLDDHGHPTVVAGVPPDYFSSTGQLWGNPLYRWGAHKQTGYEWWVRRMKKIFEMVDIVRIDHFRGFEAYWEVPGNEDTAIKGKWVPGPGAALFRTLEKRLGKLPIIAEDLGIITPPVEALRDRFRFPGMRVLQFAFGGDPLANVYRPENHIKNCAVYTGTHDNDTTVGWFNSESGKDSTRTQQDIEKERAVILQYLGTDGREIHWDMIAQAEGSRANTCVVPLQDILGLGSEARMNIPGTKSGNWNWRFTWDMLTPEIKARLRSLTEENGRA